MTNSPITAARRLVVKIGSSSLTAPDGGVDQARVDALVDAVARRRSGGTEVVIVSSGAIAAGLAPLGLARRPRDLATLQAAASVGQGELVARYSAAFSRHGQPVGQVLLTVEDIIRRAHYRNAQRTLDRLLALGVIPVVNENDTVATEEIRFGDNDRLAALVALLVRADALVLLSDVSSLYDRDPRHPQSRPVTDVTSDADLATVRVGASGPRGIGSGGMATKVDAARLTAHAGVPALIAGAADVTAVLAGERRGTLFHPVGPRVSARLAWLAHASAPRGRLCLDAGAVRAVVEQRTSLLPAGVTGVSGDFRAGDPVDLVDPGGAVVARGLVGYDAGELPALLGRSTRDLGLREVVHRDDLVVMRA